MKNWKHEIVIHPITLIGQPIAGFGQGADDLHHFLTCPKDDPGDEPGEACEYIIALNDRIGVLERELVDAKDKIEDLQSDLSDSQFNRGR